jgi:predicted transglutaminase-like cysteine proteinase
MKYLLLFVFCILILHLFTRKCHETFTNITDTDLLLDDVYERMPIKIASKTRKELSSYNSDINTSVGSFEQITNNVKNWEQPDNGTCPNNDFCNNIYKKKIFNIKPFTPANINDKYRINMYVSNNI